MSAEFEGATLREPSHVPIAAAVVAALASTALLVASLNSNAGEGWAAWAGIAGVGGLTMALPAILVLARWRPRGRGRVGRVVACEQGLFFGDMLVASIPRLLDARVRWRRSGRPYVDFFTARIDVDLERDEQAFALIDALALERERGIAWFDVAGLPHRGATIAALVALSWLAIAVAGGSPWLVGWFAIMFLAPFVVRTRVRVGRDGVLVQALGWSRFTAYDDIVRVDYDRRNVWMHTGAGKRLRLPGARGLEGTLRRAIDRTRPNDDVEQRLLRAGRTTRDWLAALRTVRPHLNEVRYRVAEVPESRLWAVVEDGRAEPSARLGAAVALAAGIDERARARLREAARATADPQLSSALARVATVSASEQEEEDTLADVLEAMR